MLSVDDVLHRANGSPVATRGGVERLEGGHPWAITDRSAELEGLSDKTEQGVEGNSPRGDRGGVEFAHDVRHVLVEECGGGLCGMEAWMANNLNKEIDVVRETGDLKEIRGRRAYLEITQSTLQFADRFLTSGVMSDQLPVGRKKL
jgi:hypothetical protein